MPRMMRALIAVVAAVLTLGLGATAAHATSPDPFNTTGGTARLTTSTILGDSFCSLSRVAGGIANGHGSITSFNVDNCTGVLTGITGFLAIDVLVDLSTTPPTVTVSFAGVTITNILGGTCLYAGTLTGTGTPGTGNATVSGSLVLDASRSSGFCTDPAAVILEVSFPGLTF